MVETYASKLSFFLTLTYDNQHLPLFNGFPSINYKDVQDFHKRLRKFLETNNLGNYKYYCVAEYGGKLGRPHYHLYMFFDILDTISDVPFEIIWSNGRVDMRPYSPATLHYITKFHMYPKVSGHLCPGKPPVSRMSKGIGERYLKELQYLPYYITYNGFTYPIPRYYRKKYYNLHPDEQPTDKVFSFFIDKLAERFPNKSLSQLERDVRYIDKKLRKEQQKYFSNSNYVNFHTYS